MKKTYLEPSIYFTEKDIYDALMSSKRTMTTQLIIELARDKGIILSSEDSRDDLIKYLSSLVYDYYDLNVLIEHITPSHKKEKTKVTKLDTEVDDNILNHVVKDISNDDISIIINKDQKNPKRTVLDIAYDEIDFSKTRLRQKVRKQSVIEITQEKGSTTISKSSNDKIDEIMEKVLNGIETKSNIKIQERKINLYGWSAEKKIDYFTTLILGIDDCQLKDVVKVTVNHEEDHEAEAEIANMITNASFKGKGLLSTSEYIELKKNGYYISSIIWTSLENKPNGNIIEFEASLSTGKASEEVNFSVKGVYRFRKKDTYTIGRRPLNPEELLLYPKILEKAAFYSYEKVEINGEPNG